MTPSTRSHAGISHHQVLFTSAFFLKYGWLTVKPVTLSFFTAVSALTPGYSCHVVPASPSLSSRSGSSRLKPREDW